jgi:hypothetical protein
MNSIFYAMNSIIFDDYEIYFQKEEGSIQCNLVEYDVNSDLRILIDDEENPNFVISIPSCFSTKKWVDSISLSNVIVFRNSRCKTECKDDEEIYLGLTRYSDDFFKIYIDLYVSSYQKIKQKADEYFTSEKPIFLVDLDKTLIICNAEQMNIEQQQQFKSDFFIRDYSVYSRNEFEYHVMIRPGSKEFLQKLFEMTDRVYIITAGERYYAESIIDKACEIWQVPLKYIFSVRVGDNVSKLKKFSQILPLRFSKIGVSYLAFDDNMYAWEESERNKVIKVKPFDTCDHHESDFKEILENLL